MHTIDGYDVRGQVIGLVAQHLKPGMFHKAETVTDGAFRRLAQKVDLELLARVARADCLGRTGGFDCSAMDWFSSARARSASSISPRRRSCWDATCWPSASQPGPRVGELLRQVYEKQLDGEITTLDEGIRELERLLL